MENSNDFKKEDIPIILAVIFILSAISIWGYQMYYWLRYAEWNSFSLLWPLSYISDLQNWVYYPSDWIGFHNVLDFIPISIILIIIGIVTFIYNEN